MDSFFDQQGNPVTLDELIRQVSEAVLANLMAFDATGIKREQLKIAIGPDGGTIVGGGSMFQTRLERRLTEEQAHQLLDACSVLFDSYDQGQISPARLEEIKRRNNFENKVVAIRQKQSRNN